ncbi:UNVERIFIED_CONTAM: bifunctional isocitrate dehydrogenase kinase/phosphatase, partial [Salmonella enterica subsp. enterica serovar Weltevreden]
SRDTGCVLAAIQRRIGNVKLRANFQIQVLSSLFFRNKGAYVVGKVINGFNELPFALPILHNPQGKLVIDTSTVAPETAREAAAMLEKVGARFVDAPITGGTEGARTG